MLCQLRNPAKSLRLFVPFALILLAGILQCAAANTLCVSKSANPSCPYATIGSAVAAAAPGDTINVKPGVYKEFVTIGMSLSLVGTDPHSTFIDATGLSNGVYINNSIGPVSNVLITGFTIENANFEGILINNASSVTIWGNRVSNNDKSLQPSPTAPVCPGLTAVYPFESNEADDCGEGIHLSSVSASIIAYNTVNSNAGGILVSDDTGPTHDNVIRNNDVENNVMDCGITVPSHTPFGVYHNTVSENTVINNGTSPLNGGGAGVGIFSPGGPTSNYGNAVIHNILVENGIGGVAIHTHAPGTEMLQDEQIVGNYISGNGGDTDIGLAPTQTNGIAILITGGKVSGIVISQNTFDNEKEDVVISTNEALSINATLNNFNQGAIAVDNLGPAPGFSGSPLVTGNASVNAVDNWWGCRAGPGAKGCATISNAVSSGPLASTVLSSPWLEMQLGDTEQEAAFPAHGPF